MVRSARRGQRDFAQAQPRTEAAPGHSAGETGLFSSIRCKIETVFAWWKRSAGYRRVRYVGQSANRLELEFKSICWNLKRLANFERGMNRNPQTTRQRDRTGQNQSAEPHAANAARAILPL